MGWGRGAALDPSPGKWRPAGRQHSTPGQMLASDRALTQNHHLLSHPKVVVRRPTCPLGPPLHCPPGWDRTTIPERGAGRHALPDAPAPTPDSRPLVPPRCPRPVTPRTAGPGNSPARSRSRCARTRGPRRPGREAVVLASTHPPTHPGQEGAHSKTAPTMPAR